MCAGRSTASLPQRIDSLQPVLHASVRGLAYMPPYPGAPSRSPGGDPLDTLAGRLLVVTGSNELLVIDERTGDVTPVLQGHREEIPALACHRAGQVSFRVV